MGSFLAPNILLICRIFWTIILNLLLFLFADIALGTVWIEFADYSSGYAHAIMWMLLIRVRFGNTKYLHISVAFIQMLEALMPVPTFLFAFNMSLVSVRIVSSYRKIHFIVIGTAYQVTGIFSEAMRLVLAQVLQTKGSTLNPITNLEQPGMEVSQNKFNFWIFFSNAISARTLNFSIFLVIGKTVAVTFRVSGVLKDWILITLLTVIFYQI